MQFDRIADKKRVEFIIAEITRAIPPPAIVLDVGCGNGIISRAVANAGYSVLAIDSSATTIENARIANSHPSIEYRVLSESEFQPDPASIDAIICSEVLEHLVFPEQLLKKLHRALRRDGVLIVTVPNGYGPREILVTKPVQFLQKNKFTASVLNKAKSSLGYTGQTVQSSADDLTHIQFFSPRSLKRLALRTGFRITQFRHSNFIEQAFPYSLLTREFINLQRLDCNIADVLPAIFTSGFMTVWKKLPQA